MTNIDDNTLLISLQAVYQNIKRYETLLDSEILRDPENIEELLVSYDEALKTLKSLYQDALERGANFPPLESVLFAG